MNIQKRDIAVSIILTLVTCGIYGIIWFINLTDEVKRASDDTEFVSGGLAFLLSLVTCGIFEIYWAYKIGELMKKAEEKNGMPIKENSVLYLILHLFGLGIVTYALVQSELNDIVTKNEA